MISYIRGILADVYSDRVIVENQGMGFEIFLSGNDINHMPLIGTDLILHTYLYVREDMMMLYGFRKREDLDTFKLLITVSGIGPKGALAILSVLPARELWMAVEMDDAKTIATAPGVGKKTAQKMIIELKDKMKNLEQSISFGRGEAADAAVASDGDGAENTAEDIKDQVGSLEDTVSYRAIQKEGIEALVALGYNQGEAAKAVRGVKAEDLPSMDVESLLKKALKNLL